MNARRLCKVVEEVERRSCNNFEEEAAALDVSKSDHTMGHLVGLLVLREAQEFEKDIEREEESDQVFDPEDPRDADIEVDGGKIHRSKARVDDDDEHKTVPESHERALRVQLHAVLASLLLGAFVHVIFTLTGLVQAAALIFVHRLPAAALVDFALHILGPVDEH